MWACLGLGAMKALSNQRPAGMGQLFFFFFLGGGVGCSRALKRGEIVPEPCTLDRFTKQYTRNKEAQLAFPLDTAPCIVSSLGFPLLFKNTRPPPFYKPHTHPPTSPPLYSRNRSITIALAPPPPLQMEAVPMYASFCFRALSNPPTMRAPEHPIGCPRPTAPPFTFT